MHYLKIHKVIIDGCEKVGQKAIRSSKKWKKAGETVNMSVGKYTIEGSIFDWIVENDISLSLSL